jgi:hypothetical protein
LGTNDILMGHQVGTLLANLQSLLDIIKAGLPNTTTTIVGSIINRNANDSYPVLTGYNAALPSFVANQTGMRAYFADVNRRSNWCVDARAGFPCTGLHPTTAGYGGMAMAWFEVLAPLLPIVNTSAVL